MQQYFQYDTLQQKLKSLEEENQKLRMEVSRASWRMPLSALLSLEHPSCPPGRQEVLPVMLSPSAPLPQATNIATETCQYEDQEQQLMIDCVEQFCTYLGVCRRCPAGRGRVRAPVLTDPGPPAAEASQQVVHLSEELAHRAEDAARQQEEIAQLLAQVADLQQKCRTVRVPCPCPCPCPCRGERGEGTAP